MNRKNKNSSDKKQNKKVKSITESTFKDGFAMPKGFMTVEEGLRLCLKEIEKIYNEK